MVVVDLVRDTFYSTSSAYIFFCSSRDVHFLGAFVGTSWGLVFVSSKEASYGAGFSQSFTLFSSVAFFLVSTCWDISIV